MKITITDTEIVITDLRPVEQTIVVEELAESYDVEVDDERTAHG